MRFDIITIFPEAFESYLKVSILKRAQERGLVKVNFHNPREFSDLKHKNVDDTPYGGGAGMVLMAPPILKTVKKITGGKKNKRSKVVVFSAKGKPFTQKTAYHWAKKIDNLIFVSGRYEGIDERVRIALKAEEISIGPYVLTDGDIASMAVISAVSRLIPGVIRVESLTEESHWNLLLKKEKVTSAGNGLEYPHYTRPESFVWQGKKFSVPKILLSGNHKKIEAWRKKNN